MHKVRIIAFNSRARSRRSRYRIDGRFYMVGEKTYGASQDHRSSRGVRPSPADARTSSPDIQGTLRIEGTLRPEAQTFLVVKPFRDRAPTTAMDTAFSLSRPGSFQNSGNQLR